MALTPESQKKVDAHLGAKWKEMKCPVCGGTAWKPGEPSALVGLSGHTPNTNVQCTYVLPVVCDDCAFVRLLSLDAIGASPNPYTA